MLNTTLTNILRLCWDVKCVPQRCPETINQPHLCVPSLLGDSVAPGAISRFHIVRPGLETTVKLPELRNVCDV